MRELVPFFVGLRRLAVGGYRIYEAKLVSTAVASTTNYTQVVQVTKGSLDATVGVVGQLEAEQSASLAFEQMSGTATLLTLSKVLSVPLQGTLQGGVTVYSVPVSLTGAEGGEKGRGESLLVGMPANVEIQVAQATDALLAPTMALQQSNGTYQVLVPNTTDSTGDLEAVPVEVGVSDGTYTVVTEGLNAGDQVLVQLDTSDSSSNSSNAGGSNILMSVSRQLGG